MERKGKERKGKERKGKEMSIYTLLFIVCILSNPANYTMPAFLCKRSPDGTTQTEVADIQLQLNTHLPTRRDGRLSWPGWLTYSGQFTHISGHPSAKGRAQDRKVRRPKADVLPLCHATNWPTYQLTNRQTDREKERETYVGRRSWRDSSGGIGAHSWIIV